MNKTLAWRNSWDVPKDIQEESKAALLERDGAKRAEMYSDLQKKVREQGPFIFLWQETEVAGLRKNVQNFKLGPTFDTNFLSAGDEVDTGRDIAMGFDRVRQPSSASRRLPPHAGEGVAARLCLFDYFPQGAHHDRACTRISAPSDTACVHACLCDRPLYPDRHRHFLRPAGGHVLYRARRAHRSGVGHRRRSRKPEAPTMRR